MDELGEKKWNVARDDTWKWDLWKAVPIHIIPSTPYPMKNPISSQRWIASLVVRNVCEMAITSPHDTQKDAASGRTWRTEDTYSKIERYASIDNMWCTQIKTCWKKEYTWIILWVVCLWTRVITTGHCLNPPKAGGIRDGENVPQMDGHVAQNWKQKRRCAIRGWYQHHALSERRRPKTFHGTFKTASLLLNQHNNVNLYRMRSPRTLFDDVWQLISINRIQRSV